MRLIFSWSNLIRCLLVFSLGIPLGVGLSIAEPMIARFYFAFVSERVINTMATPAGGPLGVKHVIIIAANNLIPVTIGFCFPPLIASYHLRYADRHPRKYARSVMMRDPGKYRSPRGSLAAELSNNLTVFGYAVTFVFGFFVFGAFFGYFLNLGGPALLARALSVIAPHAPFEVVSMLMSASVALSVRDHLLTRDSLAETSEMRKRLWELVWSRGFGASLGFVVLMVWLGAFVEVYVSAPLAGLS